MKIWKIALLMSDMKAARELYVEKLGFPIVNTIDVGEHGECLVLDAAGVKLELIPAGVFNGSPGGLDKPGMHHISLWSDEVEKDAAAFKSKGVPVVLEPFNPVPGMTLAFFEGLDGVKVQLFNQK
jgi:catechol 2,3-dioxygenase-like lactoylglutathione lyase family enzyme